MQVPRQSPWDPPRFSTAPAVWKFSTEASVRTLKLLRTVHLYCSLRPYRPTSPYFYLIQSIESRISRVVPYGPPIPIPITDTTGKIAGLLRITQWAVKAEVTASELLSLYRQWRLSNDMSSALDIWPDPDIDQIETYFVLKDLQICSESQLESLVRELETLHSLYLQSASLGVDHDQVQIPAVTPSWVAWPTTDTNTTSPSESPATPCTGSRITRTPRAIKSCTTANTSRRAAR